jgi:hypothetical protein
VLPGSTRQLQRHYRSSNHDDSDDDKLEAAVRVQSLLNVKMLKEAPYLAKERSQEHLYLHDF